MNRAGILLSLALVPAFAGPAAAVRIDGAPILVPVATHAPGVGGTEWRTDLSIANPFNADQEVWLTFTPITGSPVTVTRTIPHYGQSTFADVVGDLFGSSSATGTILVDGPPEKTRVEVRARIYNVGNPAGQFGQFVPGFPVEMLSRQSHLGALSGIDGNRLNVGAANPGPVAIDVQVYFYGDAGYLGGGIVHVEPHQVVQVNDAFRIWSIAPAGNLLVDLSSSEPFYGYGSVVRNDTGDAYFVFGTAPNTGP
jgi:hypothetical protein